MSKLDKIELAEMLAELRAQLLAAQSEGAGKDLKLEISDVEIEVQIETTKKADGKGGVKFWVYNAEAGVSGSEAMTHRLKLKLRPTGPNGEAPVRVGASGSLPK
ncbi:trypco2 family protein [uncultured Thiodictyon sp.]|uniref:trypco2 family protein n=1 Tax=uncultured Thiodictyon sp. TaxID=1846217 RepID=UPI0025DC7DC4|nr:trypco2 family protein [uncultured Thiodictyon sp.]